MLHNKVDRVGGSPEPHPLAPAAMSCACSAADARRRCCSSCDLSSVTALLCTSWGKGEREESGEQGLSPRVRAGVTETERKRVGSKLCH